MVPKWEQTTDPMQPTFNSNFDAVEFNLQLPDRSVKAVIPVQALSRLGASKDDRQGCIAWARLHEGEIWKAALRRLRANRLQIVVMLDERAFD
jgi:hypothetical protein